MGAISIWRREGKVAAKHLTIRRTVHLTNNFPAPNVNTPESKKPWYRLLRQLPQWCRMSQDLGLNCPNDYLKFSIWLCQSMESWSEATDKDAFA